MAEEKFLSDIVRKQYLALESVRDEEINGLMTQYSIKRDDAELKYWRNIAEQEKQLFQKCITHSELYHKTGKENFEFEGYVVEDDDIYQILHYAHVKQENVDGVGVRIWARGDKDTDCSSPDDVKFYKITIDDYPELRKNAYSEPRRSVSFEIHLSQTWTRYKIMQEFNEIVDKVKARIDFDYFGLVYGNLDNIWIRGP